jgi:hypothetical protein
MPRYCCIIGVWDSRLAIVLGSEGGADILTINL